MNRGHIASSGERKAAIIHETSPIGDVGALSLMLLRLGARWFALEVHAIVEVALKGAVTRVPTAPNHILGITCLSGRLITVISLEQMTGGAGLLARENTATLPRLVVLRHGDYEMAVVAEGIHGLAEHVVRDNAADPPTLALPDFVREEFVWRDNRVALLDVPRLIAAAARLSGIDSPSETVEA